MDDTGFVSRQGKGYFCSPKYPNRLWGPPKVPFSRYGSFFSLGSIRRGVKLTTPSSTEIKNEWSYISTPPVYTFMMWMGTLLPFYRGRVRYTMLTFITRHTDCTTLSLHTVRLVWNGECDCGIMSCDGEGGGISFKSP